VSKMIQGTAKEERSAPYCAAATTGCQGVGNAVLVLALSTGRAFLRGMWSGFRFYLRRRRDFHSSTVTGRCWGGGTLAYDARLLMWGEDRHARPSPKTLSQRRDAVSLEETGWKQKVHNKRHRHDTKSAESPFLTSRICRSRLKVRTVFVLDAGASAARSLERTGNSSHPFRNITNHMAR
jgi:hypothetical protein